MPQPVALLVVMRHQLLKAKQPCANFKNRANKLCMLCAAVHYCSAACQQVCFKGPAHTAQCEAKLHEIMWLHTDVWQCVVLLAVHIAALRYIVVAVCSSKLTSSEHQPSVTQSISCTVSST
jgi:hypothetical protein